MLKIVRTMCPHCGTVREIPGGPATSLCDDCRDRLDAERQAIADREREAKREELRAKRARTILDVLRDAGVNVWDHRHATLESFDGSQSGPQPVDAVKAFLAEVKAAGKYDQVRGLYLFGQTGSGKSHLAVAAARELLLNPDMHEGDVVYDHALRLIGKIQRTYSNDESADEVLNRRINAKVWILDDLGTEAPSADVVRRLTEIFTERAMRPTIVTSNLPPDALEGRNPEFFRVVSRLGPRYFRTVQVRGSDRRFEAA